MIYQQFYSELGKLLYAIADIDGVITPQEKKVLQNSVQKELVSQEQHVDEFGSDVAFYTEIVFDYMNEQTADAESAFKSFIAFIEEHHTALDKNLVSATKHVAKKLAAAYKGTNKKEKVLLEKLMQTLDKFEIKK